VVFVTDAGDAGKLIDSVPAAATSGTTRSSDTTVRPVRESNTYGGAPSTSAAGAPSTRASLTMSPAGIGMRAHPSRKTSRVKTPRPVIVSPSMCRSYSTRESVPSTGRFGTGGPTARERSRSAWYSSIESTTHPSGGGVCARTRVVPHTLHPTIAAAIQPARRMGPPRRSSGARSVRNHGMPGGLQMLVRLLSRETCANSCDRPIQPGRRSSGTKVEIQRVVFRAGFDNFIAPHSV